MSNKEFRLIVEILLELKASIDALKSAVPEEVLLDSTQMQRLLQCSASTLFRLRKSGTIPCNKIGRRYYYPKQFFTQEFLNTITKVEDLSKRFDDK